MPINYPTSLDTLTNPTATDYLNSPSHAAQHANANDILEALEAKVGINSSAVTTSHDYKLSGVTGTDKAASLTGTETLTNKTIDLGENAGLVIDAALSADGKYSGITEDGTAGAALAFGDLCYFQASDSRWELVDANLSAGYDKKLGMCVLAAAADGNATKMLLYGKVRADAKFPALTIAAPVYMSETAGAIVVAQPTTADAAIRIIGFGNTADELFFTPSQDYIVHN